MFCFSGWRCDASCGDASSTVQSKPLRSAITSPSIDAIAVRPTLLALGFANPIALRPTRPLLGFTVALRPTAPTPAAKASCMEPDADDVTLLAQAWPRTEQAMVNRAEGGKVSFQAGEASTLVDAVRRAMRVEVQTAEHGLKYVLLFDVDSDDGPNPAYYVMSKLEKVEQLAKRHTPHRIRRVPTEVRIVPRDEAVAGVVCPRLMPAYRGTPWVNPDLPPGWG